MRCIRICVVEVIQVKSGLKYGFRFRVYDKGIREGDDHSLWLVEPVLEVDSFKVKDIAGKNRIAHSTKKKVLFGIVDNEGAVTYLETSWRTDVIGEGLESGE
jgi:tRNA-intron lyase